LIFGFTLPPRWECLFLSKRYFLQYTEQMFTPLQGQLFFLGGEGEPNSRNSHLAQGAREIFWKERCASGEQKMVLAFASLLGRLRRLR
jgi:hypothetical protein